MPCPRGMLSPGGGGLLPSAPLLCPTALPLQCLLQRPLLLATASRQPAPCPTHIKDLRKVSLALKNPNKRLEHQGIKVEFIGQIELYYDRGNHHEFVSLVKDLARPGEVTQSQAFDFEFTHVEKPYESYTGQNVKLR